MLSIAPAIHMFGDSHWFNYSSTGMLFSWGICVPMQCDSDDALYLANIWVKNVTASAAKVPGLDFLSDLTVAPGICRSNSDPEPSFNAGMILFFSVIGLIGWLTVLGTAYDYFVVELKLLDRVSWWRRRGDVNGDGFGWKRMDTPVENDAVIEAELNGAVGAGRGGGGGRRRKKEEEAGEHIQVKGDAAWRGRNDWFVKLILCFSMLTNGRKILALGDMIVTERE